MDSNSALRPFSAVRQTTNHSLDAGIGVGDIVFILDVYADGNDIEFSRPEDGSTIAFLFLTQTDIEPATELALRSEPASV